MSSQYNELFVNVIFVMISLDFETMRHDNIKLQQLHMGWANVLANIAIDYL